MPAHPTTLGAGAQLPWAEAFTDVITHAQRLLHPTARFRPHAHHVNGVFALTPDNLPFLGPHPSQDDIWVAQALWVTHAAGAAHLLAEAITHKHRAAAALSVERFAGTNRDLLHAKALQRYNTIHDTNTTPGHRKMILPVKPPL